MTVERLCFVSLPAYGFFNPDAYDRTGGGGAKRQIHLLARELAGQFDIHVVVGDYGQAQTEQRDGVTLHRAYTPNKGHPPGQLYRLVRAMRAADADIYIHRGGPRKAAITATLTRLLRKKWVYNVASDAHLEAVYDNLNSLIRRQFRRSLNTAHAVIAQTNYQKTRLRERFGVTSTVVPNGYPPPAGGQPTDREFVLWVGRLEPCQNRPELYLDCVESLPDIQFKLVGARGDDDCSRTVQARCDELPNVEFVGSVPPTEIHSFYRNATALVNTSAYEGFPNTFLEAWRQRTPVVSLDVDPGRYLGNEQYTGYADGDFVALVEEIQRLETDTAFRTDVGTALAAYVRSHYGIETVARQYAAVIDPDS